MDCRETQELLAAFHDRELSAADRTGVEEHVRGCPKCGALLADLARADRAAGVPDPGPAYWDRFNARVMERVEREADGPKATVLRRKQGWMRQQRRYFVPAAAVAALVLGIVRYVGINPGVPSAVTPQATNEPAPPNAAGQRMAKAAPEPRAAIKAESSTVTRPGQPMAMDGQVPGQAGPRTSEPRPMAMDGQVPGQAGMPRNPEPRPMAIANEQFAALMRGEEDRPADRSLPSRKEEASHDRAIPPAVSPPPPMAMDGQVPRQAGMPRNLEPRPMAMDGQVPRQAGMPRNPEPRPMAMDGQVPGQAGMPVEMHAERRKMEEAAAAAMESKRAATYSGPSPCEMARTLALRKRWREAEAAQRRCLEQDRAAALQEKGLVFLAELLDRQDRFAEADTVIMEIERQFPASRPLDLYRQQRPMVQQHR